MKIRTLVPPFVLAGATAVAIAVAPMAEALPTCVSSGNASLCQSAGNAQVTATPPDVNYLPEYPFLLGGGLLFHHGHH